MTDGEPDVGPATVRVARRVKTSGTWACSR